MDFRLALFRDASKRPYHTNWAKDAGPCLTLLQDGHIKDKVHLGVFQDYSQIIITLIIRENRLGVRLCTRGSRDV